MLGQRRLSQQSLEVGHALANTLLERSRPFTPPPPSVLADIKRRALGGPAVVGARRTLWARRLAIAGALLAAGVVFGLVLDRLYLRQSGAAIGVLPRSEPGWATVPEATPDPDVVAHIQVRPEQATPSPAVQGQDTRRRRLSARSGQQRKDVASIFSTAVPEQQPREEPAAPEPVGEPASNETEGQLLAKAVKALRVEDDPFTALVTLDDYGRRYPLGRLRVEASVLRVDTLSALHRSAEALQILDDLDLDHMPGGLERRLQRAQLRSTARRWADAVVDFDDVVARGLARGNDGLVERALWTGAKAAADNGQKSKARAYVGDYLRRFPDGRFSASATRLGERLAGPESETE